MLRAFSVRSLLALVATLGLTFLLVVPTASAVHFAQDDSGTQGDESMQDQPPNDDTAPPAVSAISLDPCQVVTPAEASTLAGASYTTGLEQTSDGGGRICVYGYQTLNVFMVVVAQAPDATTAQAAWADEQARVGDLMQGNLPPGVTINLNLNQDTALQGYDRSASGSGSGTIGPRTLSVSAIYLLKGPTFVSYSDLLLDKPAPTTDSLAGEAQTVMTRLP